MIYGIEWFEPARWRLTFGGFITETKAGGEGSAGRGVRGEGVAHEGTPQPLKQLPFPPPATFLNQHPVLFSISFKSMRNWK